MSDDNQDQDDNALLAAFSAGLLASELNEARRAQFKESAEDSLRKDKRINIRISSRDLEELQRRALQEGMPYQTLISTILHKYVAGQLQTPGQQAQKPSPLVWKTRPTRYLDDE